MRCSQRSLLYLRTIVSVTAATFVSAAPLAAQLVVPFAVPEVPADTALPVELQAAASRFHDRIAESVLIAPDRSFERAMIERTAGLTAARAQFFDGEYASCAEALGGWLQAFQADAWVLAQHEDFAARALDAMLTLARAYHSLQSPEAATDAIEATVALFPTALPQPALYPEWVIAAWQAASAEPGATIVLEASSMCSATLNGVAAPVSTPVRVSDDDLWARWDCGGRRSRLYRVAAGQTLRFDDQLDAAFVIDGAEVSVATASDDPSVQASLLGALAALLGETTLEGWTPLEDGTLQLVYYEVGDAALLLTAARGEADVAELRACAIDGRCRGSMERWQPGIGWPEPASAPRVVGIASLVAGGLATGAGVALEFALRDALERVDSCANSTACVLTPDALDDRRARASSMRSGATAAWVTAGATVVTGLVALVPAWGRREIPLAATVSRNGARITVNARF